MADTKFSALAPDTVTGTEIIPMIKGGAPKSTTPTGIAALATKTTVGLGNVDNTSDLNKPISTATQTALDGKAPIASPTFTGTVSGISKSMVGLGSVDNTSDIAKPVSTAQQAALDAKLDDTQFSGLTKITVSTSAPGSPTTGDLWVDTN